MAFPTFQDGLYFHALERLLPFEDISIKRENDFQ